MLLSVCFNYISGAGDDKKINLTKAAAGAGTPELDVLSEAAAFPGGAGALAG